MLGHETFLQSNIVFFDQMMTDCTLEFFLDEPNDRQLLVTVELISSDNEIVDIVINRIKLILKTKINTFTLITLNSHFLIETLTYRDVTIKTKIN